MHSSSTSTSNSTNNDRFIPIGTVSIPLPENYTLPPSSSSSSSTNNYIRNNYYDDWQPWLHRTTFSDLAKSDNTIQAIQFLIAKGFINAEYRVIVPPRPSSREEQEEKDPNPNANTNQNSNENIEEMEEDEDDLDLDICAIDEPPPNTSTITTQPSPSTTTASLHIRIFSLIHDTYLGYQILAKIPVESSVGKKAKSFLELLFTKSLNLSLVAWNGQPDDRSIPFILDSCPRDNTTKHVRKKLTDLYAELPSPVPNLKLLNDARIPVQKRDLLRRILDGPSPRGMKTELYIYQKNAVFKMLSRELVQDLMVEPSFFEARDMNGNVYWLHLGTFKTYQSPNYWSDIKGGIICEDMGTGKTCSSIALILSTKHFFAAPPDDAEVLCEIDPDLFPIAAVSEEGDVGASHEVSIDDHGVIPSLKQLATVVLAKEMVPYVHYKDVLSQHLWNILVSSPPFYYKTPPPPNRPVRGNAYSNFRFKIYISRASLVIVPENLLQQWQTEIMKHTHDNSLNVLIINDVKTAIPDAKALLQYDMVLMSHGRFGHEYSKSGDFSYYGILREEATTFHDEEYVSPLLQIHWMRIIVDEGHVLSSDSTRYALLASKLHVESRWICSGTPMPFILSKTDQLEVEKKDLLKLAKLCEGFLKLPIASFEKNAFTNLFSRSFLQNVYPYHYPLQDLMERIMVRNQPHVIEQYVQLPPLSERIVGLDFTPCQRLIYNLMLVMKFANFITSQETDQDFLFHPMNQKYLKGYMMNLNMSTFWFSNFNLADILSTLKNLRHERIVLASVKGHGEHELYYLRLCEYWLVRILTDTVCQRLLFTTEEVHDIQYFIGGMPKGSLSRWQPTAQLIHSGSNASSSVEENNPLSSWSIEHDRVFTKPSEPNVSNSTLLEFVGGKEIEIARHVMNGAMREKTEYEEWVNKVLPVIEDFETRRTVLESGNSTDEPALQKFDLTVSALLHVNSIPEYEVIKRAATSFSDFITMDLSSVQLQENAYPNRTFLTQVPSDFQTLNTTALVYQIQILSSTSSKLNYICNEIIRHASNNEKIIIYSESNYSEMYYIHEICRLAKIRCLLFHRQGMHGKERAANITTFNTSENIQVFIMDVALSAFGIDLSSASRVYFLTPIWENAKERQAIKRAHRIGSKKPVFVETLYIRGSIDEQVLNLRQSIQGESVTGPQKMKEEISSKLKYIVRNADFIQDERDKRDMEDYFTEIERNGLSTTVDDQIHVIPKLTNANYEWEEFQHPLKLFHLRMKRSALSDTTADVGVTDTVMGEDEEEDIDYYDENFMQNLGIKLETTSAKPASTTDTSPESTTTTKGVKRSASRSKKSSRSKKVKPTVKKPEQVPEDDSEEIGLPTGPFSLQFPMLRNIMMEGNGSSSSSMKPSAIATPPESPVLSKPTTSVATKRVTFSFGPDSQVEEIEEEEMNEDDAIMEDFSTPTTTIVKN